jgi:hypothetical protein
VARQEGRNRRSRRRARPQVRVRAWISTIADAVCLTCDGSGACSCARAGGGPHEWPIGWPNEEPIEEPTEPAGRGARALWAPPRDRAGRPRGGAAEVVGNSDHAGARARRALLLAGGRVVDARAPISDPARRRHAGRGRGHRAVRARFRARKDRALERRAGTHGPPPARTARGGRAGDAAEILGHAGQRERSGIDGEVSRERAPGGRRCGGARGGRRDAGGRSRAPGASRS